MTSASDSSVATLRLLPLPLSSSRLPSNIKLHQHVQEPQKCEPHELKE